jgi:CheY-like chemotaxis protein
MLRVLTTVGLALLAGVLTVGVVLSVDDTVDLLDALQAFVWPLLAFWLVWRLLPVVIEVVRSRRFEIEIGGLTFRVQDFIAQLPKVIDDLRDAGPATREATAPPGPPPPAGRLLWVDDREEANVWEKATLLTDGWAIETATSTAEALRLAGGDWTRFDVVISDMGREEGGRDVPDAGVELVARIRETDVQVPVFIYTGRNGWKWRDQAIAAGANGLTSSSGELLAMVRGAVAGR